MRRTVGAVALLGMLFAACTPEAVLPTAPPSPPVSQSPTETAQERQERLDYAAAEKSYRTFRAEYNRVLRAGGAKEPTKVMKATAGGKYLEELMEIVHAAKGLGDHQEGNEKVIFVRPGGYSSTELSLEVCEDTRATRVVDAEGKELGRGELRTASLLVKSVDGHWKVWSGQGKKVNSCA